MHVIHVHAHVRAEDVAAFREATLVNAAQSLREPGVARFDVIQQQDDPSRFVLVEAYRTAEAVAAHKVTPHYTAWRDAVAPMMAAPRSSTKYANVFPADEDYGMAPGTGRP
jgi:quinol monooxygenase YgiN